MCNGVIKFWDLQVRSSYVFILGFYVFDDKNIK
uniref:Uncharacterized protein n=1 Tax=viral metagenome TaxID=1070528 RepID=A0A6C0F3I0_9ZZZZ